MAPAVRRPGNNAPAPQPRVPARPPAPCRPSPALAPPLGAPPRALPHASELGSSAAAMADLAPFMLCESFFAHCPRHTAAAPREAQLNFWDLSCNAPCCALCVAAAPLDTYLQVGAAAARRCGQGGDCDGARLRACRSRWIPRLTRRPAAPRSPPPQVRRSSYHDVVKMQDMSRFADIGGIQGALCCCAAPVLPPIPHLALPIPPALPRLPLLTEPLPHRRHAHCPCPAGYTINSSKVIFLRRRPQPRPPKGAVGASVCTVCSRHLQDVSQYCSLQCKMDASAGVKHVSLRKLATGAPPAPAHAHSSGSSGGGAPGTPSHLQQLSRALDATAAFFAAGSDSDCM